MMMIYTIFLPPACTALLCRLYAVLLLVMVAASNKIGWDGHVVTEIGYLLE